MYPRLPCLLLFAVLTLALPAGAVDIGFSASNGNEWVSLYDQYIVDDSIEVSEQACASFVGGVGITDRRRISGSGDAMQLQAYSGSAGPMGSNYLKASGAEHLYLTSMASIRPDLIGLSQGVFLAHAVGAELLLTGWFGVEEVGIDTQLRRGSLGSSQIMLVGSDVSASQTAEIWAAEATSLSWARNARMDFASGSVSVFDGYMSADQRVAEGGDESQGYAFAGQNVLVVGLGSAEVISIDSEGRSARSVSIVNEGSLSAEMMTEADGCARSYQSASLMGSGISFSEAQMGGDMAHIAIVILRGEMLLEQWAVSEEWAEVVEASRAKAELIHTEIDARDAAGDQVNSYMTVEGGELDSSQMAIGAGIETSLFGRYAAFGALSADSETSAGSIAGNGAFMGAQLLMDEGSFDATRMARAGVEAVVFGSLESLGTLEADARTSSRSADGNVVLAMTDIDMEGGQYESLQGGRADGSAAAFHRVDAEDAASASARGISRGPEGIVASNIDVPQSLGDFSSATFLEADGWARGLQGFSAEGEEITARTFADDWNSISEITTFVDRNRPENPTLLGWIEMEAGAPGSNVEQGIEARGRIASDLDGGSSHLELRYDSIGVDSILGAGTVGGDWTNRHTVFHLDPLVGTETIQSSVDEALDHNIAYDWILAYPGLYEEHDISVNKNLVIAGFGSDQSVVDAQSEGRIFAIGETNAQADVTLANLGMVHGLAPLDPSGAAMGGGIINWATLTLIRSDLSESLAQGADGAGRGADAFGGGIYSEGELTLVDSTVRENAALGGDGTGSDGFGADGQGSEGAGTDGYGGSAFGGGIYSLGPLALVRSEILDNVAQGGNGYGGQGIGGAGVEGDDGADSIIFGEPGSVGEDGGAGGSGLGGNGIGGDALGGGIYSFGVLSILDSDLLRNLAQGGGGVGGRAQGGLGGEGGSGGDGVLANLVYNATDGGCGGAGGLGGSGTGGNGRGGDALGGAIFSQGDMVVFRTDIEENLACGGIGIGGSGIGWTGGSGGAGGDGGSTVIVPGPVQPVQAGGGIGGLGGLGGESFGGSGLGGDALGGGIFTDGRSAIIQSQLLDNVALGGDGIGGDALGGFGGQGGSGGDEGEGETPLDDPDTSDGGDGNLGGSGLAGIGLGGSAFGGGVYGEGELLLLGSRIASNVASGGAGFGSYTEEGHGGVGGAAGLGGEDGWDLWHYVVTDLGPDRLNGRDAATGGNGGGSDGFGGSAFGGGIFSRDLLAVVESDIESNLAIGGDGFGHGGAGGSGYGAEGGLGGEGGNQTAPSGSDAGLGGSGGTGGVGTGSDGYGGAARGGGIFNLGEMSVEWSSVNFNVAQGGRGVGGDGIGGLAAGGASGGAGGEGGNPIDPSGIGGLGGAGGAGGAGGNAEGGRGEGGIGEAAVSSTMAWHL